MKQLTYTSLDKCYSNHQIKGDITLYSIFIETYKTIPETFNLEFDGAITYTKRNVGTSATVLVIQKGIYTLKSLEKQIQKGNDTDGIDIKIQVEEQRILLILPPEYDVILSPNILKMLRLTNIKKNEWIKKLENYSIPFQTVNTIYVYCKQLCQSTHLIDGKYTNCLYTTPLLVNQTVIFHSPAKHIYLPVEYPTRYLEFKILDQNGKNIPIKNIILQVLNK